jgi:hypothetical protein
MASDAVFGFVGVVLGAPTTSALTIYKERVTGARETAARDGQFERDREAARDAFQRDSVLALQSAVTHLVKAASDEMDRLLADFRETGRWTARARVFDTEIRELATKLREIASESVWAQDAETCKQASRQLEPLQIHFHEAVARVLATLY